MPRLVLHAGLPKTGSTSIQAFLHANSRALGERGVFYHPADDQTGRRDDHNFLAVAFWNQVQRIYAKKYGDDLKRLHRDSREAWIELLEKFRKSDNQVLLISGEFFVRSSVPSMAEFAKEHLTEFDVEVLFYLRQPSSHYVSWLQQHIKGSNTLLPFSRRRGHWTELLRLWRQIGDVTVREFDRDALVGGDVVTDFASAIGIDVGGMERPDDANESISTEGMDLVLEHRRFHWPDGPDRLMPQTLKLIERIRRRESELDDETTFTVLQLHSDLSAYLDSDVTELAKLERQFGFRYASIGSPDELERLETRPKLEGRVFDDLQQLVPINASAKAVLKRQLELSGIDFGH